MNKKNADSAIKPGEKTAIVAIPEPRKRLLLIAVICVVIVVGVVAGILISRTLQNKARINVSKLNALVQSNDCSKKAMQSIGSDKPNKQQVDASITLLNYRGYCLVKNGNYKQASAELEQLKSYYAIKGDKVAIKNLNQRIATVNYAATHHGRPYTNAHPELSQTEAAKLQKFYEAHQ